jgi:hypothetical protein
MERNPVILEATRSFSESDLVAHLKELPQESIYDESRVAQPDEVWNFQRGDGLECAIALANCLRDRHPEMPLQLLVSPRSAKLQTSEATYEFESQKGLKKELEI